MYYIRKLDKPSTYNKLVNMDEIENIDSDILGQELRTSSNTLSFWKCESLDNQQDTINAILLSTNKIDTFRFIVIDSELFEKYGLEMVDNSMPTGYKGYDYLHTDLSYLTYGKIGLVLKVFSEAVKNDEKSVINYKKPDVQKIIQKLHNEDKIDFTKIDDNLRRHMKKFIKDIE